jgi:hypothetical protein
MRSVSRILGVSLAILLVAGGLSAQRVPEASAIPNWAVPATWSPSQASGGIHTMTDISDAIPFVAIEPCRIADTRAINGFGGQAGGPIIPSNTTRTFQISGTPTVVPAPPNGCAANAIPASAEAVSFQFTIVSPSADGNLIAWDGGTIPQVSVLNWPAGTVALGNGTIVPLSAAGVLSVRLNMAAGQSAHLVIDVNGYFSETLNAGTLFNLISNDANAAMLVTNTNTGSSADGIRAVQNSLGLAFGVFGKHEAASGEGYGVGGETDSVTPDSAGVSGIGPGNAILSTANLSSAGVRGEDGGTEFGVIGAAETHTVDVTNAAGGFYLMNNGLSTIAASGLIGYRSCFTIMFQICTTRAATFTGSVFISGNFEASGTKSFVEPMAGDATKMINYVSLEGPEAGTYFRGKGRFVRGMASIDVPDHFREVTDPASLSVQITPIGDMATYAVVRAGLDQILVKSSRNVEFYYTVNGMRRAYKDHQVIQPNTAFVPESADSKLPESMPQEIRNRLVANGLFNADGSVNMETAERVGLTRGWAEAAAFREAEAKKNND